jgi:hypothetical protein
MEERMASERLLMRSVPPFSIADGSWLAVATSSTLGFLVVRTVAMVSSCEILKFSSLVLRWRQGWREDEKW